MKRVNWLFAGAFGLLIGVLAVILDLFTDNMGNIFSQLAVFILIGVVISLYSNKPITAAVNMFSFSAFMLLGYYLLKYLLKIDIFVDYIVGWAVVCLISPFLAIIVYSSKKRNVFSLIIKVGIVMVSLLSSYILFDRIRFYDILINLIIVYFLFFRKDYYEI
ncbi:MAG: hypothetical protein ACI4WG_05565 [Erysipelotrichaceae bacterium]